ncbi:MAG: TolC family protein, partial [Terriglobales bacterium]
AYPDYYQWTVGMSLPLFHRGSRQRPEQQRAAAQAVRQQAHYTATLHQQRYQLDSLLITAHSQEQILALTHDGLLPQARAAVQSAMAAFRAGTLDLRPALDAARQLLQVQQQYWHAVAEHETTLARIRALTGGPHA